jgi:hypothetical protein
MLRQPVIELLVIKGPTIQNKPVTLNPSCAIPKRLLEKQRLVHTSNALLMALDFDDKTEVSKRNRERTEIHRAARLLVQSLGDEPNAIEWQHSALDNLKPVPHLSRLELPQPLGGCYCGQIRVGGKK